MDGILKYKKLLATFAVLAIFLSGAVSVLAFPIDKVSSFKQTALRKFGITHARVTFPQVLDTSRYQLSLLPNNSLDGVFQLADIDSNNFLAFERFSGELYSFREGTDGFKRSKLGNVFDQLNLYSSKTAALEGQKIDNAGNAKVAKPTIFATAFDIEYAFGHAYLSVTLPSKNQSCTSLNLYQFDISMSVARPIANSKLLFSTPCVVDKKNPTMWAGRITHSPKNLYLSVGEQRYDPSGFPKKDSLSESEIKNVNSVSGKVLEFDPRSGSFSIYSSGHRNAQGLYYSTDLRKLIESEHGPFGGDEVNILNRGGNFGWPFGTFGKPYPLFNSGNKLDESRSVNPSKSIDKELAKFGAVSGSQPGARLPIMSWIPGVGAGNIAQVQNSSDFKDWHGNILVSLMQDASLHRLILAGDSVVLDERIPLGFRVRDFIVNDDGYLVLSTDQGRLLIYKITAQ
jgi:glucose/arabinose dehydrogenase